MKAVRVLLVLMLALAAIGNLAWAGTVGKINGVVIDAETREPLPGAVITMLGTAMGANTDLDGRYTISNVPVGTYTVQAKMMGYETQNITGIKAIMDLTTPVNFRLKSTIIEMEGTVVKGDRGVIQVRADITSTTKTVSTKEIENMAGVRSYQDVVAAQSGVVETSGGGSGMTSGMHVRGGRANEIAYFVDGLSTQDQVTGTSGANINNNAIQEVMVITGGFNAEYGSAMSGVVNVVTKSGAAKLEGMMRVRTDAVFPEENELNLGYNGFEANLGGPIYKLTDFKFFLSGEIFRRQYDDGWVALPNTEREFYSGQAKLTMDKRMFKASVGGFLSRTQFGYFYGREFNGDFRYNAKGMPSRMQKSQQVQTSITHMLSKDIFYNANVAYFKTTTTTGVRKHNAEGFEGWFADYEFKQPYSNNWFKDPTNPFYTGDTLEGYRDFNKDSPDSNPYGVAKFYYIGDYPNYSKRESKYVLGRLDMTAQATQAHQLKSGMELKFNTVKFHSIGYAASSIYNDSTGEVNYTYQGDDYTYYPFTGSFYLQDKMEFQGLVVNAGLRLDMLNTQAEHLADVTDLQNIVWVETKMKYKVSPRLGISFPISEITALRFSYGQFFQQPDMMYLYESLSGATSNNVSSLGNPDLNAQQTTTFELGLQHQFSATLLANVTAYYKDIYHLLGMRNIPATPRSYYLYIDSDYGNVKGVEVQLDAQLTRWLTGRASYALSVARGSSSYVWEVYDINYAGGSDWIPKQDYNLEYDQRHNISASLSLGLEQGDGPKVFGIRPLEMLNANISTNAGSGYPYTKTDLDNKPLELNNSSRLPWTFSTDMRISRDFKVWRLSPSLFLEVDNLFNNQNVASVYSGTGNPISDGWYENGKLLIYASPIPRYYDDGSPNPLYSTKADIDRNDYISAEEHYLAVVKAHDELQRDGLYTYPYEASRRVKLGMSISF